MPAAKRQFNAPLHGLQRRHHQVRGSVAPGGLQLKYLLTRKVALCALVGQHRYANSEKLRQREIEVAQDLAAQIAAGTRCICAVMVESRVRADPQKLSASKDDRAKLDFGTSITATRFGWED